MMNTLNKKVLDCILLVDDNKFTNIFNRRVLEKIHAAKNIYAVEDGAEALDFILKKGKFSSEEKNLPAPDLVLLDINMPIMDGWEFLENFKEIDINFKNSVIVILTTSHNPEDKAKALSIIDVDDYYVKPLNQRMMEEIINKHFNKNRQ